MEVSKVLRLSRKLQRIFWKRRKVLGLAPATQNDFRYACRHVRMSGSATPATQNDILICLETLERRGFAAFPNPFTLCSYNIDVFLRRVFLWTSKFATPKSMFRARLPSIFITCRQMPRLPRNPKCRACHEKCNSSSENDATVYCVRLQHKTDFGHVMKHVGMSQSATPATRNEATRRLKPPKVTTFAKLARGTAIATSRGRLWAVADGCRTVAPRLANTASTPKPPEWNGNPRYAFGNKDAGILSFSMNQTITNVLCFNLPIIFHVSRAKRLHHPQFYPYYIWSCLV